MPVVAVVVAPACVLWGGFFLAAGVLVVVSAVRSVVPFGVRPACLGAAAGFPGVVFAFSIVADRFPEGAVPAGADGCPACRGLQRAESVVSGSVWMVV
uniref:Uncharacterized protein n=1 Tax=Anopheles darlingi TaxID=43151 RepID=A0A2M4D4Y8_ANODA